jgi:prolyl-tRNA synthetase
MLREDDGDAAILDYGAELAAALTVQSALAEPIRVFLDKRAGKAQSKRWEWLKKGAPLVVEIGPRDVEGGKVAVIRRDALYREDGKLATIFPDKSAFISEAAGMLEAIQRGLYAEAKARLDANIRRDLGEWTAIESYFRNTAVPGWVEIGWSRPTGAALDAAVEKVKALKLTMRNVPLDGARPSGACPFTGEPAVERILIGRAY